jgi:tetratricopeptide (TPR) repeat protein
LSQYLPKTQLEDLIDLKNNPDAIIRKARFSRSSITDHRSRTRWNMANYSRLHWRWKGNRYLFVLVMVIIGLLTCPRPALADVAPPESPPGSNLAPGSESTQVRMEAETVILDVLSQSQSSWIGQAKVTATFHMRNLGSRDENMQVRFPLSNWNGYGDGFGNFPEIRDLRVKVDGKTIPTQRIMTASPNAYADRQIPWAAFPVAFPIQQEIQIEVTYTADGFGEANFVVFSYILETGAGWYDTIGTADLIVRLPYEANPMNVIFEQIGFGSTSPGAEFQGSELRWQYKDFEPEAADNLQVALVTPAAWNKVLLEQGRLQKNPDDGEAWGRLGKAYKEIILLRKGMREDQGGLEAYQLAVAAYDQAVTLKPDDALWHYGFADLLWSHYYWVDQWADPQDYTYLQRALIELKRSLELDPNNQLSTDLLDWIAGDMPEAVEVNGSQITYLILTATPLPEATATLVASDTPAATVTELPLPSATQAATSTSLPIDTVTPQPSITRTMIATAEPAQAATNGRGLLPCGSGLLPLVGFLLLRLAKKGLSVGRVEY